MNSTRWICLIVMLSAFISATGCDYARMNDDAGIRLYEQQLPDMPTQTIPVSGGEVPIRAIDPSELKNPLRPSKSVMERGKELYGYFCAQCHGPRGDGNGIVGQHFDPRPTDLRRASLQVQPDGIIFQTISYGKGSQPPLAYTIAREDRWRIIHYMRTLNSSFSRAK
jgi:mono/diheme cytochrome c family protein